MITKTNVNRGDHVVCHFRRLPLPKITMTLLMALTLVMTLTLVVTLTFTRSNSNPTDTTSNIPPYHIPSYTILHQSPNIWIPLASDK